MTIGTRPLPLPCVAVKLVIVGSDRAKGSEGSQREGIGFVLIPALKSAIFCPVFVLDHGHFGACCNVNIGMEPKAPLPENK